MYKKFHPADRNLTINPALKKTNSPWPFLIALVVVGLVVLVFRSYFTPDVSITRPALETIGNRASATTVATNHTDSPATLKVRIKIGHLTLAGEHGPARFAIYAQQDVSATIAPHSTAPMRCELLLQESEYPNYAEAELLRSR